MRFILAIVVICLALPAFADQRSEYCFDDAAKRTGVNKDILIAIAMVESNLSKDSVSNNHNGTEDVGLMQINSSHFQMLKEAGINRKDLFNACINIHVSALILKDCIRIHGNTWAAVGAYNVGHRNSLRADRLRRVYASKVWLKYKQLKGIV
jgi:soluble lytic murein transglycosylase-like protein